MKALAVTAATLFSGVVLTAPAAAQDWVLGGLADSAAQFYDQARVRASGQRRIVWVTTVHSQVQSTDDGTRYDYTLARTEFDCYNETSRWIAVRSYLLSREAPTFSFDGEGDWTAFTPGSMVQMTADMVCAGEPKDSLDATSPHEIASRARAVLWPSAGS